MNWFKKVKAAATGEYHVTIQHFASGATYHDQHYQICYADSRSDAVERVLYNYPTWTKETHKFETSGSGYLIDLTVTELDRDLTSQISAIPDREK